LPCNVNSSYDGSLLQDDYFRAVCPYRAFSERIVTGSDPDIHIKIPGDFKLINWLHVKNKPFPPCP